ncbi:macrolide family glycosyltransferase [Myxococcus landrumensis]|uniref:Glycosyl transferase n=1 Tax=Myxococcus landrumensis TaxID=2813577 RepID=A0ABX7N5D3_9BACT|nr:macrolide family glycosyltransferase [Myxococcus landrumus]QSQ13663.1 glycosyl transferase [Myxococcus landrumus]
MRRRAHIAMVSIPAHGHVNPSLEVIRELVARGHRVTYANDPSFADAIARTGAELVPYPSTLPREGVPGRDWPEDTLGQLSVFLDDAMAQLPRLRAAYEKDRPDLFLYDIAGFVARILAENWGLPAVHLSPTYVAWEGYTEEMAGVMESLRAAPGGADYYRRFTQWLKDCGVAETDSTLFVGLPTRSLVLIPRAMQPHADRVDPKRYTFVGPCIDEQRASQGTWSRPAHAKKVLLISLGSTFTNQPAFYRQCMAAFGALEDWHVVLNIGRHLEPSALGALPSNFEVHAWLPQLSVLQQSDVFITHAGMGSAQEGLWCGKPMLAVPQATDQFSNADRIVELGVGLRLDTAQATAVSLRAAFERLIREPHFMKQAAMLQRELREEGGARRAADLIEQALPRLD